MKPRLEIIVYRPFEAHDPITSPAPFVIESANGFTDRRTEPLYLWRIDLINLKDTGWS